MSRSINRGVAAVWMALMGIGVTGGAVLAEPPSSAPQDARQAEASLIEQARSLQRNGKWEEAAEAWEQVTKHDPDNGTAWFNYGYCLHAAGRLEEAIEVHQRASTFDDYRGIALYNLGCAYALTDRPDEAFDALAGSQAAGFSLRNHAPNDSDLEPLREDPRFAALLANEPAGIQGRLQQALARARQMMQQQVPQARQQISAKLQQVARQTQGLLALLQQKLASDERFAVIAQRVKAWLGGGQVDAGARQDAPPAGTQPSEPRKATATLEQAHRHQQAGEWDEAAATYAELVEQDPDNPTFAFGLAISLHMGEHYEKAIEAHRKAAEFDQTRGVALYNLACAYALTGQTDKALEALDASGETGFDIHEAAPSDSDFDSIRDDPRFKKLLADREY